MNSNGSDNRLEKAASILDQLLKFTEQLETCENDPKVNVVAIAEACAERVGDLEKLLPQPLNKSAVNGNGSARQDHRILERIRELHARTRVCLEILDKKRTGAAAELQELTRAKQAVTAYKL